MVAERHFFKFPAFVECSHGYVLVIGGGNGHDLAVATDAPHSVRLFRGQLTGQSLAGFCVVPSDEIGCRIRF